MGLGVGKGKKKHLVFEWATPSLPSSSFSFPFSFQLFDLEILHHRSPSQSKGVHENQTEILRSPATQDTAHTISEKDKMEDLRTKG